MTCVHGTWDMCGHGTAVAPRNWTPWRLRHHWAAPQRFNSQENIQQSAQMRHSSKHFCQIFTSLEFTLSLTSILWQSVWIKLCEIDGQGVFFSPNFLDIWIGICDKCITFSALQTPSTPRHTNWSPAPHLVSRENHQSGFCKNKTKYFELQQNDN